MDESAMKRYDRQWLLDFFSLGAWAHQYTGVALYQAAQRIPTDNTIAPTDRPRIQAALRAKILGEVAASMETLGRLCWSIEHRAPNGIAAEFINMREDKAVPFYKEVVIPPITVEGLLKRFNLPPLSTLTTIAVNEDVKEFLEQLSTALVRYASIYIDSDGTNSTNANLLRRSYNAVKHGSHVIANAPVLVEPSKIREDPHSIYIATHWPKRNEEMSEATLGMVTRSMKPKDVLDDLDVIRTIAVIMTNLCQLLIALIDQNMLAYG